MMQTNEQVVVDAKEKIEDLKADYMRALDTFIASDNKSYEIRLQELLNCQQKGATLFNFVENFVGDSDLLGAHLNGGWVTGFAEDCYSHMGSLVRHFQFLRAQLTKFPELEGSFEPDKTAYANMQRMIKKYLRTEISKNLRQQFVDNDLPTWGFDVKATEIEEVPRWQILTCLVIGILFLVATVFGAILIPEPSEYQEFIGRGIFSIGLASVSPIIPGFAKLTSKMNFQGSAFVLVAGGSIAVFFFVMLINPPKL